MRFGHEERVAYQLGEQLGLRIHSVNPKGCLVHRDCSEESLVERRRVLASSGCIRLASSSAAECLVLVGCLVG